MAFKTDIEIAREAKKKPIMEIGAKLGIPAEHLLPYGHDKAKVGQEFIKSLEKKPMGKLILVTAINPTPAGEGKTTTTVGLGDGLNRIGKKAIVCIREASLGPNFGMKGGAAGGGYSQVVPMEEMNLHFTGDFHAITSAHNLLSAMIDNHIYWGNSLDIDERRVMWRRVMDMNDRSLRDIAIGLGGPRNGFPRQTGFDITVASEVMAIFCLATDLKDLQRRLANIVVGQTRDKQPITAKQINADGAMTALLKDAILPNLVQTLEGTPAFIHGGPFANIAHGCNSVMATTTALKLADYVVTEAGFGADLGAEKFMDIKCRKTGLAPSAVVIVATVRALKMHGGVPKDQLKGENLEALKKGFANLERHLQNVGKFGVPAVVAINKFVHDTDAEHKLLAVIGLDNVVVVETKDAVLVMSKDQAQDVKKIVETLKKEGRTEHLEHLRVYRPWGWYESVDSGEGFQVKRLMVTPGGKLSLQLHHYRAEHWVVVQGEATVRVGDTSNLRKVNESVYIPIGEKHRLENKCTTPLHLIEVQSGSYLGEDDIVRLDDLYQRN